MNKGRPSLLLAGILVVAGILIYSISSHGADKISKVAQQFRADVIKIDAMNIFGKLEKPAVFFLHEAHTDALAKKDKDCTVCHLTKDDVILSKFKRIENTGRKEVMNIYHQGCISCHGEMKAAREKSGPIECDDCHREKTLYSYSGLPIGFDNSLHFRHSRAQEKKCELCHHEYDEKTKKLFYVKGKEGTCRYCHLTEKKENLSSMREASHIACINCHKKNLVKNLKAGPVNCSGCHDLFAQQKIEKITPIPRIERNQPDIIMVKTGDKGLDSSLKNRMNFVPFDHKAHEGYNDTCRTCHHQDLSKCNRCHTLGGLKDGRNIILEEAMHKTGAEQSCMGCHETNQANQNCAGCHAFIEKNRQDDSSACIICHISPLPGTLEVSEQTGKEAIQAGILLNSRKSITELSNVKEIPEKVVIKGLADAYEPVEFPHLRIIETIVKNIKDKKLASYFHAERGTICQGCHHHSPLTQNPTGCGNCHGKEFTETYLFKPSLMGSYHIKCIGCHSKMGIKKPEGCTGCHSEKKNLRVSVK